MPDSEFAIISIKNFRKNTCFLTPTPCPQPPLCGRPHLALGTALLACSVIAGDLRCYSLTSTSQHAAQSKEKIDRKFM